MSTVTKKLIDLDGLATFKSKYDEKIENEITTIADETIQALFDNLYATLTYTTTSANETVQIAYINSYFDSIIVEEDDEELLDGTQGEDNSGTVEYTFAEAGEHTVKVRILDSTDLSYLFYNCTALTSVSSSLFALAKSNISFAYTFYGCTGLTSLPDDLFANCVNVTDYYGVLWGCSSLVSLPNNLFGSNTNSVSFSNAIRNCGALESLPSNLFANCPNATSYNRCFRFDYALTGETPVNSAGLKLWELAGTDGYPDEIDGTECFSYCTNLDDYDEIDDDWK